LEDQKVYRGLYIGVYSNNSLLLFFHDHITTQMNSTAWKIISYAAMELVENLLRVDPDRRLSADQALRHPWLDVSIHNFFFYFIEIILIWDNHNLCLYLF